MQGLLVLLLLYVFTLPLLTLIALSWHFVVVFIYLNAVLFITLLCNNFISANYDARVIVIHRYS